MSPVEGDDFSFGDQVAFEVEVTDDQPVDCDQVTVSYILGHDEHGHPLSEASGCSGTIQTSWPPATVPATTSAACSWPSTPTPARTGVPPLTGRDEVVLVPSD